MQPDWFALASLVKRPSISDTDHPDQGIPLILNHEPHEDRKQHMKRRAFDKQRLVPLPVIMPRNELLRRTPVAFIKDPSPAFHGLTISPVEPYHLNLVLADYFFL